MIQQIISKLATEYNFSPKTLISSLAILVFVNKISLKLIESKQKAQLKLAPYKYPFIGSTMDYYKNQHALIKSLTEKLGPQFRFHFHGDMVTVVGAADATEVFNHPDLSFMQSQNKYFSLALIHGSEANARIRELGINVVMKQLIPHLNEYGTSAYKEFLFDARSILKDELVVDDLGPFLNRFISRTTGSLMVGSDLCRDERLFDVFENFVSDVGKEFTPSPLRVVSPLLNRLYMKYFYKSSGTIEKYRNATKEVLLENLDQLKASWTTNPNTCSIVSYAMNTFFDEINDEAIHMLVTIIIVFTFVAVHTTSEALTYVMYCLVKYPEYLEELREEQESLLPGFERGNNDEPIPTAAVCRRMVKLDSFIQEALRIRKGGVGLAHTNIANHNVQLKSGAVIEPGAEVLINLWHVNFDDNNQTPLHNLETFDGFRFLTREAAVTKSGRQNIIFGLGRHTCPGRWFAVYQIKSIMSYFIRNYDLTAMSEIKMIHSNNEQVNMPQGSVKFTKRRT